MFSLTDGKWKLVDMTYISFFKTIVWLAIKTDYLMRMIVSIVSCETHAQCTWPQPIGSKSLEIRNYLSITPEEKH